MGYDSSGAEPSDPTNTGADTVSDYDIEFFWDPICPFAWITSRWVDRVVARTGYRVDWRFISLRILNERRDYATEFPPEYPRLHGAGHRMLRVAARARADHGRATMGPLYAAYGTSIWDREPVPGGLRGDVGEPGHIAEVLAAVGLPAALADAADDPNLDDELRVDTETALGRVGHDVGTPVISFRPPDGPSFFGPVISRVPDDDAAVELWDAVIRLATWPGFAEMKRSLREVPRLRALGADPEAEAQVEDWEGGRRRLG